MIVKNEYVKIKANKKEYTLKNYIYDRYLKLFSDRQKETYREIAVTEDVYTDFTSCYIKFDEPLSDYKNAKSEDFDLRVNRKNVNIAGNEKGVEIIYNYSYLSGTSKDLSEYEGKKITAIGFASTIHYSSITYNTIYACVDTSYYSIYLDNSIGIEISRKDKIYSNAVCDGYEYPLHLAPVLARQSEPNDKYKGATGKIRAILYSVGFGSLRGEMQQEFIIGKDAEINTINDTTYGIVMKNPVEIPKYPKKNTFPSGSRYPVAPKYSMSIYPKEKGLYPSQKRYPTKAGYNYIIFKYRLYYNILNSIEYLDEYYTMSYFYNPKGVFTTTNTIERG